MATEEVKIVVSGEVQAFHSAMAQVQSSLQNTNKLASNLQFAGATKGLRSLGKTALASSREGLTIKEAFNEIGNAKLPLQQVKDLGETFQMLAKTVADLAPVIKMAASALAGFLSGKLQDFIKLFGSIEKGSRAFLWLRRALPVRAFRESGVAAKRFNGVITSTGETIGKMVGLVSRSFRAVGAATKGATDEVSDAAETMEQDLEAVTNTPRTINISGGWGIPKAAELDDQVGSELERVQDNATIDIVPNVEEPELPSTEKIEFGTAADISQALSGLDQVHDAAREQDAKVDVNLAAPDSAEIATEVKAAIATAQSTADAAPVAVSAQADTDIELNVNTNEVQSRFAVVRKAAKKAGEVAGQGFSILGAAIRKAGPPAKNLGTELIKLPFKTVAAGFRQVKKEVAENEGAWRATRAAFATTGAALKPLTISMRGLGIASKAVGGQLLRLAKVPALPAFISLKSASKGVGDGLKTITQKTREFAAAAKQDPAGTMVKGMRKFGKAATIHIAAILAIKAALKGLKTAAEGAGNSLGHTVNKGMAKAFGAAPRISEDAKQEITKDLRELQSEFGILSQDAIPALNTALAAGVDKGDSIALLREAALLSRAGVISLGEATTALTQTMQAFSMEGLNAAKASDVLTKASQLSGKSINEFSGAMRELGPMASAAGISFEESAASMATLMRQGHDASEAYMMLRELIKQVAAPTAEAQAQFDKLGIKTGEAALLAQGLSGVLDQVAGATQGNAAKMGELLDGHQALTAALALGAANGQVLTNNLNAVQTASGATAANADVMKNKFGQAIEMISAKIEVMKLTLLDSLTPFLNKIGEVAVTFVNKMAKGFKTVAEIFKQGQLGEFIKNGLIIAFRAAWLTYLDLGMAYTTAVYKGIITGIQTIPNYWKDVGTAMLGVVAKLQAAFFSLAGDMLIAFQKPITYLQAGFTKVIEVVKEQIDRLPVIGNGGKFKARSIDQIKEAVEQSGALSRAGNNLKELASDMDDGAAAIFDSHGKRAAEYFEGIGTAMKEGAAEGFQHLAANDAALNDARAKNAAIFADAMVAVDAAEAKAAAKRANQRANLVKVDEGSKRGLAKLEAGKDKGSGDMAVVASSLQAIGGGGGAFGSMVDVAIDQLAVQQRTLEQTEQTNRLLAAQNKPAVS